MILKVNFNNLAAPPAAPQGRRPMIRSRTSPPVVLCALLPAVLSCHRSPPPQVGPTPPTYFTARVTDRRFHVADHMLASIEMQLSGEPFAQLLGRSLGGYDRFSRIPDLYVDPMGGGPRVDVLGYAAA